MAVPQVSWSCTFLDLFGPWRETWLVAFLAGDTHWEVVEIHRDLDDREDWSAFERPVRSSLNLHGEELHRFRSRWGRNLPFRPPSICGSIIGPPFGPPYVRKHSAEVHHSLDLTG